MSKCKRKKIKNFISSYLILILIISGTILFFLINPKYIYDSNSRFTYNHSFYDKVDHFIIIPYEDTPLCISMLQRSSLNNVVCIKYRNMVTNELSEHELLNVSCNSLLGGSFSRFYYDKENDCVYTILTANSSEYYLYKVWNDGKMCLEYEKIFDYNLFYELQDTTIVINNLKFYKSYFAEKTELHNYLDGYRISFSEKYKESLKKIRNINIENNEFLYMTAKHVTDRLSIEFSNFDIYKNIEFFRRNNYYQQTIFNKPDWENKGFLPANIIGMLDANNDSHRDVLIQICGRRWINDILLCFDIHNQEIIWEREFANGLQNNVQIVDIDNDNEEEIMFSTNSPCCEMPINWFEIQDAGFTNRSYFRVLSNNGENKLINNKPFKIQSNPGFYKYNYLYLEKEKKILLGLFSENNNSEKRVEILDLKTNEITNSNISYNHIIRFYYNDRKIIYFNLYNGILTKNVLNNKFNITKKKTISVSENYLHLFDEVIEIFGRLYFLSNKFKLYDENLDIVNLDKTIKLSSNVQIIDNSLYFLEKTNEKHNLSRMDFHPNNKLNPFFILLITFELVLILMYYYFRQLLFLPFVSGESSYAVLYKIFGSLYFWRIYGKLSFYKFPHNLSRSKNRFFYLLKDLTTDFKEIYNKRSFLMQIQLFQLNTQNELFLVQRIAHDIKNQLHLINLQLSDYEEEKEEDVPSYSEKIIEQIKPTMKEIYKKTLLLSGFSKLFELNIENKDLIMILGNIIMEYSNHPQFSRIVFKPKFDSFYVDIDENLFHIAFRNLIDNALKYSEKENNINIELDIFKMDYQLRIKNQGSISEKILNGINEGLLSESYTGSGVGIQITKKILENFNGTFEIRSENGFVIVTMRMPIKYEQNLGKV